MVFVKVRETYDIKTVKNRMTVIGIHTPKANIIKANFPGLLVQCKAYRPVSCDIVVASASALPLDPLGVGQEIGDVAPEDVFNPILYKALTNAGMSNLESRIYALGAGTTQGDDIDGPSVNLDVDSVTDQSDEFGVYYSLLSNSHGWKTASPQAGLVMRDVRPLVYEVLADNGMNNANGGINGSGTNGVVPTQNQSNLALNVGGFFIKGNAKPMPFMNTTFVNGSSSVSGANIGFSDTASNIQQGIPAPRVMCAAIIVPPSKLRELFFRMTVEWTLEFSQIRPISEVCTWADMTALANTTHYQNYDYSTSSKAEGLSESTMTESQNMVDSNVDIKKVM